MNNNLRPHPDQVNQIVAALDAAIGDVQAFESEHGGQTLLTEPPIKNEAELYRNLRRLKREYANALEVENDQHIEAISEWAEPALYEREGFQAMGFRQQSDLVRHCMRKRKAAEKRVRDIPDDIEARAALARAEDEASVLYYWHLVYLVNPHFPQKLPTHNTPCYDALRREHAKNARRRDAYAADDLRTIENATRYVATQMCE